MDIKYTIGDKVVVNKGKYGVEECEIIGIIIDANSVAYKLKAFELNIPAKKLREGVKIINQNEIIQTNEKTSSK